MKYDEDKPAPITESQVLMPCRHDDGRRDLWSVFDRTQENLTKGGLAGIVGPRKQPVMRDLYFHPTHTLSEYTRLAERDGAIPG
ncbi:MAG: hypothetical protein HONDAALG_03542 [Gammaproteobacteria bacterium]|nr:hypothetical protein [Gammaproteobacteria bacterium]